MMVVGPTGVGKSTLLNSLLCPAKWTTEYEDCIFKTDNSLSSVTKNITGITAPWLGDTQSSVIPLVKVFDTPGLGDSDSSSDATTLESIVDVINNHSVNAFLLVFKATDRFNYHIQKQLRTLEYILGSQLWDHAITVLTFWGFGTDDIQERIENCIKERKATFDGDIQRTRDHCERFDFENEKVEEWAAGYENYLGVTHRIPHSFPHPKFDYNDEEERTIFFDNAMKIYDNAKNMSVVRCDEDCERRLEIALLSEEKTPFILGRDQQVDAGQEMLLQCHLYLGLGESAEKEIKWWHNSSRLNNKKIRQRNILVQDEILFDVTKESQLFIENTTFEDAGVYKCSITEDRIPKKSPDVHVKVLIRK